MEQRANAFAAALLMPGAGVAWFLEEILEKGGPTRELLYIYSVADETRHDAQRRSKPGTLDVTYQDVHFVARHFGVSYDASCYRLKSLNLISKGECENLLEKKTYADRLRNLLPSPENDDKADRELITQVAQLAGEAYRLGQISKGKLLDLSKMLQIRGSDLVDLAEAAKVAP